MSIKARVFYSLLNFIVEDTFNRANRWFDEHPNDYFCYWAKDTFLSEKDKKDNSKLEKFLKEHKEIDDIDDHTIVERIDNMIVLSRFCPRLKEMIREYLNEYPWCKKIDNIQVKFQLDKDNYRLTLE